MTKRYKVEVEQIKREIISLFDYDFSKDHIVVYDFNLFLCGYHMPAHSPGIAWYRSILETQSNKESKSYQKKISSLTMNAWVKYGTMRYEVNKRIFIDTIQEVLDVTHKSKLEVVLSTLIAEMPANIYTENLQTLELESRKSLIAHLK